MALNPWRIKPALGQTTRDIVVGAPPLALTNALLLGKTAEVAPSNAASVWLSHAKEQVVAVVGNAGAGRRLP